MTGSSKKRLIGCPRSGFATTRFRRGSSAGIATMFVIVDIFCSLFEIALRESTLSRYPNGLRLPLQPIPLQVLQRSRSLITYISLPRDISASFEEFASYGWVEMRYADDLGGTSLYRLQSTTPNLTNLLRRIKTQQYH